MFLLAACSEPEMPPTEPGNAPAEEQSNATDKQQADAFHDQLPARWLELEHAAQKQAVTAEPLFTAMADIPAIAIVIDDVGHNLGHGRRLLALPVPVALAILPKTVAAQRLADEAAEVGRTVLLHQPMENGAGLSIGPGGLYSYMSGVEIQQTLTANLDNFAHIRGINNHMGSRLTSERKAMDWVMQVLNERGLFFIDSRTTSYTQAAFAAEAAGVRHLSRDIFLDNERTAEAIGTAFSRALELARKRGSALIIGHPYPQTIEFLEQRLAGDFFEREGVRVVSVKELLARKYQQ